MLWQYPQALDTALFVVQNRVVQVEFTQSARKHRVGRARVRQVLDDPVAEAILPAERGRQGVWSFSEMTLPAGPLR